MDRVKLSWFEKAVQNGAFGRDVVRVIGVEPEPSAQTLGAQFASDLVLAQVRLETSSGDSKVCSVVVKLVPGEESTQEVMNSKVQFHNEACMYEELLPYLGVEHLFPKFYYASSEAIVLENLKLQGFKVTDEKVFIDYDHIKLAIDCVARFHAASYLQKQKNMNTFKEKVGKLIIHKVGGCVRDDFDVSLRNTIARGVKPLSSEYPELEEFMKKTYSANDCLDRLKEPEEPTAVLCHGDFCRNNMMFKYDDKGRPIEVRMIDLQTSCYSSPAIDLSFFLYLNTNQAMRDSKWEQILFHYFNSMASHLTPEVHASFQQFIHDFSKRAVYGYFLCSFFLPVMTSDEPPAGPGAFLEMTPEERHQEMVAKGGEPATRLLVDIVQHLLDKGYIQKYNECF